MDKPSGTTIQFGYDADYNRTTKSITSGGVSHSVNDVYVLGHLAYETDQTGTVLATFTYDSNGVPVSVQVGSDPNSSPCYYYVYNGHGDVVALVDAQGNVAASYAYDAFGQLTSASENFGGTTTWTNPYRYVGRDGVRYDGESNCCAGGCVGVVRQQKRSFRDVNRGYDNIGWIQDKLEQAGER